MVIHSEGRLSSIVNKPRNMSIHASLFFSRAVKFDIDLGKLVRFIIESNYRSILKWFSLQFLIEKNVIHNWL